MAMKFVSSHKTHKKRMCDMGDGEVCQVELNGKYVVKVTHPGQETIFLILGDDEQTNSYGSQCSQWVRPLPKGETITIEFS